jgi:hypothetical protein
MAEQTEFEFPDEIEAKNPREGGKVVTPESETDIEVVDDTPPADRHRTPMKEAPAPVTDEELAKYSDQKLKDRLAHINKGYHEERRAKEAAVREREEALRMAEAVVEENKRLQGSLANNQTALLEQAKKVVESEIDNAQREYKEAYESGDTDRLIKAQSKLTAAAIRADKVNNFKPAPLQEPKTVVKPAQQASQVPELDENTKAWVSKNPWWGANRKMTAYALTLHEDIVESGIPAASDEYFAAVDADMKQRFPEAFAEEPAEAKPSQRVKSNVVAPASRSTAPRKIVLTQTQVNIAKRLGVPLELYARKVAEEMRKQA